MSYEPKVGDEIEIVGPAEFTHALSSDCYGKTVIKRIIKTKCDRTQRGLHIEFDFNEGGQLIRGLTVDFEAIRPCINGSSVNATLEETILALPASDQQRLYKLLYNSGCRINR